MADKDRVNEIWSAEAQFKTTTARQYVASIDAIAEYADDFLVLPVEPSDNDERGEYVESVINVITGKLADRIRARIGASQNDEITFTETITTYYMSDVTVETGYAFVLKTSSGYVKDFNPDLFERCNSIVALCNWLDQPSSN